MTDPSSPATPPPGGPTPPAAPRFVQPYPGAPPVPVMDAGPAPVPPGPPPAPAQAHPDTRPRTLGIIALCLAIGGALIALVPFLGFLAIPLLLAAVVLAVVALVSRSQGGTGLSVAALVVSGVTVCTAVLFTLASLFFVVVGSGFASSPLRDDMTVPSPPAPDFVAQSDLRLVDTAFGPAGDGDRWWYAVVVDNPNLDAAFDAQEVTVLALGADGEPLGVAYEYLTVLPGATALAGTFEEVGGEEIVTLEVLLPTAYDASPLGAVPGGELTVRDVVDSTDGVSTFVSGVVTSTASSDDAAIVLVSLLARDASGTIVGAARGYADLDPSAGGAFDAVFTPALPEGTSVEAYPSR